MRSVNTQPVWKANAARITAAVTLALVLFALQPLMAQGPGEHWVGTWSTSEVGRPQTPPAAVPVPPPFMANQCPPVPPPAPAFMHFSNQTLRQIVHTSIGGSRARVVFSNRYGTAPLAIGAAHLALRDKDSAIQPASVRPLTFSGKPTFTIPPGAIAYSDPVNLTVPQMGDLAIDLYLPGNTDIPAPLTMHVGAFQTNYVSERAITPGPPSCRFPARFRTGSSCIESRSWRPPRSAVWLPLAIRLPTAPGRRRTATTAGRISSCDGCYRRPLRSGWAS